MYGLSRQAARPRTAPTTADTSKLGRFIMRYHTFLSSFVIGVAGLIATSIWQFRQSETTRTRPGAAEGRRDRRGEQLEITRAEYPVEELGCSRRPARRQRAVAALRRAAVADPRRDHRSELAVSYALELGKDSADDMTSVLANTKAQGLRPARARVLAVVRKRSTHHAHASCAWCSPGPTSCHRRCLAELERVRHRELGIR